MRFYGCEAVRTTFPAFPPSGLGLSTDTMGHIAFSGLNRICFVALFVMAEWHGVQSAEQLIL